MASEQPAQTPGIWTLSPGDAGYDEACRAAMKACGVDPDSFGSYSKRCDAQDNARAACEAQGITASNLRDEDVGTFATAESQSGHMAQNAVFQYSRDDECSNVPPTPFGDPSAPSSFGYSCEGAPCTDHFGRSNVRGTCHGEISAGVEHQAWREMGAQRNQRLPLTDPNGGPCMESQVRASAGVHVDANRQQMGGKASRDPAMVSDLANVQQRNAARMSADDPQAASLAAQGSTAPGTPASASGPGPSQAVKDFAAECEVTKWKQMMTEMRANAINGSPLGQAAQTQFGKPFTELTQEQQRQVLASNPGAFGSPPPAPPSNPPGLATPPAHGQQGSRRPPVPPSTADCLAYQGNYLAWQTANNPPGSPPSSTSSGTVPGWEGRAPGGASTPAPANSPTPSTTVEL